MVSKKRKSGKEAEIRDASIVWMHLEGFSNSDIGFLWNLGNSRVSRIIRKVVPKQKPVPGAARKAWILRNKDKIKTDQADYYQANKEKAASQSREWRLANPEKTREVSRKTMRKKHGIIDATGEARSGICPICLRDRPLVCDHYHNDPYKGYTRGWICGTCNRGIGSLQDSVDALKRAITYMENSEEELKQRHK